MAFRIASQQPQVAASKRTKPVKRDSYRAWLKTLPCVLTGRTPVDAAHISTANPGYGHLGRGKGRKASDRWAVPLCRQLHDMQHGENEAEFWKAAKCDPYIIALTLYGLWADLGDEATEIASQLILGGKVGR